MSSYSSSNVQAPDLCYCGLAPVLKTSWTDNNPGRRFWSCRLYLKNERKGCGYYLWHDPPVGVRSKNIIPGLLRKIENLEDEIKTMEIKEKKLAMWCKALVLAVVLLLVVVVVR